MSRRGDAEPLAFFLCHLVGIPRMRIASLEEGRNPQPAGGLEGVECPQGPGVDNINLRRQLLQPPRHEPIVDGASADPAKKPVRDPKLPSGKGWPNLHVSRQRPVKRTRENEDICSSGGEACYVMPGYSVDLSPAQLVRKAVQHSEPSASGAH